MALLDCRFFSNALKTASSVQVILPESGVANPEAKPAVVYLLHGLSDDDSVWVRRTSLERYVASMNVAIVMPNVHRSFYSDMVYGGAYWRFVSRELPEWVSRSFRVSSRREKTFVAGISMGGYGAFKLALNYPERFRAAASLSGALDLSDPVFRKSDDLRKVFELVYGGVDGFRRSENDLLYLVKRMGKSPGNCPQMYQWCGTKDFLYDCNTSFRKAAELAGLPLIYEEGLGGHEWEMWDAQIRRVFEWFASAYEL